MLALQDINRDTVFMYAEFYSAASIYDQVYNNLQSFIMYIAMPTVETM